MGVACRGCYIDVIPIVQGGATGSICKVHMHAEAVATCSGCCAEHACRAAVSASCVRLTSAHCVLLWLWLGYRLAAGRRHGVTAYATLRVSGGQEP